jgi:P27 family predicted phage terminase small subunit
MTKPKYRGGRPGRPIEIVALEGGRVDQRMTPTPGWSPKDGAPEEPDWHGFFPDLGMEIEVCAANARMRLTAHRAWERIVKATEKIELLAQLDYDVMVANATGAAIFQEGVRQMAVEGMTYLDKFGDPKINPIFRVIKQAHDQSKITWAPLGMTPAARNAISGTNLNELPAEVAGAIESEFGNVVNLWS